MKHLLRRIRDWAVGPGGWLIDTDINDELAAIDRELDQLEQANWPLIYTEGVAGGWHYETGKPWPKHRRPHPLGEDYPE